MKRQELVDAIKLVLPGTGEGGLGGPNVVIFDKGWIRSLNDKLSISYKIETGLDGAIPVDELNKVLDRMKGDEVTVTSDEGKATFKCGRTRLLLKKTLGEDLEKIKDKLSALDLDKVEWIQMPAKLLEGLEMSLFSAEDAEIGKLSGVVVSEGLVLSTDNYRISMYDLGENLIKDDIRVKTSSINSLVKLSKKFNFVSATEKWFNLKDKDNLVVSVRRLPFMDYPLDEVTSVFSNIAFADAKIYELPNDLEESISRAEVLAGMGVGELNFSTQISLTCKESNLSVLGQKSIGEVEDIIPWVGELPTLTASPAFLKKVLKITRAFKVTKEKNMVLFETPGFKFLMIAKVE